MKYRIRFSGQKINSLGHYSEKVERIVEATSIEDAKLKAYDTHEHIHKGVFCELVPDDTLTEPL